MASIDCTAFFLTVFCKCILTTVECIFISAHAASLRVSSVSVVRSDHFSICVSWRPVAAVSGYRIVIQALRGTTVAQTHHKLLLIINMYS